MSKLARVICLACGKNVGARPRRWDSFGPTAWRPVWHHPPAQEQPRHMGGFGCAGQYELVTEVVADQ